MPKTERDLVIVGGGPAGLTAGLYAARSRIDTLMIERFAPGGQVLNTDWVENYPGFPEGVSGFELIDRIKAQVERFELPTLSTEVQEIAPGRESFTLKLAEGSLTARALIIASGADPSRLGVEGEQSLTGHGVSYCGTCDGPFFKDQVVAAVGGGDTACAEAEYLTRFARQVYLIHRRDQLRAQKINQERVLANDKIKILWDTVVDGIEGRDSVSGISLRNVRTGAQDRLPLDGVFIFVGYKPNTGFLADLLALDRWGFIVTDPDMATSVPGVFAAGDVRSKSLRQIVTAVGEGATAAHNAERYLEGLRSGK